MSKKPQPPAPTAADPREAPPSRNAPRQIQGHHGVVVSIEDDGQVSSPLGAQHALKALALHIAGLTPDEEQELLADIKAARESGEEIGEIPVAASFSGEGGHEVTVFRDGSVKTNRQHDDAVALLGCAVAGVDAPAAATAGALTDDERREYEHMVNTIADGGALLTAAEADDFALLKAERASKGPA